jgi:glucokinase
VRRIRERYPTATDDAIARLAMRQFTRFGSVSGIFGAVAGSYAPIALLGAAALTHAELVLHLAAAYGQDPAAEERATDLLVLTRVHPDRPAAEAALAAAKQPAYEDDAKLSDALWRFGRMAMTQAGGWTAIRLVNRFFPGTSLLAATLTSRSSTETVAARARALYSQRALYSRRAPYSQESQSLGSRV